MTSSQYDRLVREAPGVGGQLVDAGALSDLISSSAGARVPWHTDTRRQHAHMNDAYACTGTPIHTKSHWIPSKWRSGTSCLWDTLRQPLNRPYDQLETHLTSLVFSCPSFILRSNIIPNGGGHFVCWSRVDCMLWAGTKMSHVCVGLVP